MTSPVALASAALQKTAALLASLTQDQLVDLVEGRGHLVFQCGDTVVAAPAVRRRAASKPKAASKLSPVDVATEVTTIDAMSTSDEVFDHLGDRRFTVAVLRELAAALGPRVSTSARVRDDLRRNIAEGTAGYKRRAAAMSEGAWV